MPCTAVNRDGRDDANAAISATLAPAHCWRLRWLAARRSAPRPDPATLTLTGTIDGSVNGIPFAVNVPFTAVASFDPSADAGGGGYGAYPPIYTLTFSSVGNIHDRGRQSGVNAGRHSPPQVTWASAPTGWRSRSQAMSATRSTMPSATFLIPPGATSETLFSSPPLATYQQPSAALVLPLVGGGTLVTANFDSFDATATLLIPEPGTLALLGLGLAVHRAAAPIARGVDAAGR